MKNKLNKIPKNRNGEISFFNVLLKLNILYEVKENKLHKAINMKLFY